MDYDFSIINISVTFSLEYPNNLSVNNRNFTVYTILIGDLTKIKFCTFE